jgi:hypothetical protein
MLTINLADLKRERDGRLQTPEARQQLTALIKANQLLYSCLRRVRINPAKRRDETAVYYDLTSQRLQLNEKLATLIKKAAVPADALGLGQLRSDQTTARNQWGRTETKTLVVYNCELITIEGLEPLFP